MKNCPVCKGLVEDDAKFCKHCGAELEINKKPDWAERRKLREEENQKILDASYIHSAQLEGLDKVDENSLSLKKINSVKNVLTKSIVLLVVGAALIAACIAAFFFIKAHSFNPTLMAVCVMIGLVIAAYGLSLVVENVYAVRMLIAMSKSKFAIKKIKYGKPPRVNVDGTLYELIISGGCDKCDCPTRHIEEVAGQFVAVCDKDRTHLAIIDTTTILKLAQ
ncbi:MAG: zinc ribbon domain-containing protein [Christensenellales bacterium]